MPVIAQPNSRTIQRSLATLSTERLQLIRKELEREVADNLFYNSTSEAGRSSSQEQMAEVHQKLNAVFAVLGQRGQLTKAEIDAFRAGLPKTIERVYTPPIGIGWR